MRCFLGSLALLAVAAFAAPAGAQPVEYAESWDEAFEEATKRNVPVLVLIGKDKKCPWTMSFRSVAKVLNDRVVLLALHRGGEHEPEKRVDPKTKEEVEVCPLYETITCAVHSELYNTKAGNFDYEGDFAGFILRPSGTTMLDGVGSMAGGALIKKLEEAQLTLGEGVFRSDIERLEAKLVKGDEKLEEGKLKYALKAYEKELERKGLKAHLKTIIEARLEKLDQKAMDLIEAARGMEPDARHEELKRIAREMKGRAPSDHAEKVLAEVEGGGQGS